MLMFLYLGFQRAYRTVLPTSRRGVDAALPQPGASNPDGVRVNHLHQDRQQVEHGAHRAHDLLQGGRRQHAGAARPARQGTA